MRRRMLRCRMLWRRFTLFLGSGFAAAPDIETQAMALDALPFCARTRDAEDLPMNDAELRLKIKELMIRELDLSELSPTRIDDASPLFGEGLGLDSLDALQLAIALEEEFGVTIPEGEEAKPIFASVNAIAQHITQQRS